MSERLDNDKLAVLRDRLNNRHAQLRVEIREALQEMGESRLADEVHDTKDRAFSDLLNAVNRADLAREVEEVRDIEAALERMAAGSYGRCTVCGDAIPFSRLSAYPTAKRCLPCQQAHERHR